MAQREIAGEDVDEVEAQIATEGQEFDAKITKILRTTAGEVFGDKARGDDAAREVIVVSFESDDGIEGSSTMTYRKHPNPKSFLYAFAKRYGSGPRKGMAVKVAQDDQGFWRLAF